MGANGDPARLLAELEASEDKITTLQEQLRSILEKALLS
jgi:hypothetical protein